MQYIYKSLYYLMVPALIGMTEVANAEQEKQSFSGFFGGVETGASFGQKGRNDNDAQLYLGGLIGYRKHLPSNWVFGLEGTFAKTGSPSGFGPELNDPLFDPSPEYFSKNVPFIMENKYEWSLAASAGHTFGENNDNLLYGKAGLAANRRDVWDFFTCRAQACAAVVSFELLEQTHYSLLVGAGYERKISDGIRLRLSLDYIAPKDLNDINFDETETIDLVNTKFSLIYQF